MGDLCVGTPLDLCLEVRSFLKLLPAVPDLPTMSRQHAKSRTWMFTLNNYTDVEKAAVLGLPDLADNDVRYVCFGTETGAEGTPHLQGYIEFKVQHRLRHVRLILGGRVHAEAVKYPDEAWGYTRKDDEVPTNVETGNWFESGKRSGGQGTRSDLLAVKASIDGGASLDKIADQHFGTFLRYERALRSYIVLQQANKQRDLPRVLVLTGPTGTGKSVAARHWAGADAAYVANGPTGVWWGAYTGQKTVVFDDFYGWLPYSLLLRILDWTPLAVDTKGGQYPLSATRFIFTSNKPWHHWYDKIETSALQRRLEEFGWRWTCEKDLFSLEKGPTRWEIGDWGDTEVSQSAR